MQKNPLLAAPTPATVFDFFTAAYHIFDYAMKEVSLPESAVNTLRQERDMRACGDLANKSKHVQLRRRRADPMADVWSGELNGAPINSLDLNSGDQFVVRTQDGEFEVRELAQRILTKWDDFLSSYGL